MMTRNEKMELKELPIPHKLRGINQRKAEGRSMFTVSQNEALVTMLVAEQEAAIEQFQQPVTELSWLLKSSVRNMDGYVLDF